MVVTVAAVVATRNPAIGVVVGSITAMVIVAKGVAHCAEATAVTAPDGTTVVYQVTGELFLAFSDGLVGRFNYTGDPKKFVIDLPAAHIGEISSAALDEIGRRQAKAAPRCPMSMCRVRPRAWPPSAPASLRRGLCRPRGIRRGAAPAHTASTRQAARGAAHPVHVLRGQAGASSPRPGWSLRSRTGTANGSRRPHGPTAPASRRCWR